MIIPLLCLKAEHKRPPSPLSWKYVRTILLLSLDSQSLGLCVNNSMRVGSHGEPPKRPECPR